MDFERIIRECGLSRTLCEALAILHDKISDETATQLIETYDKGDEAFGEAIAAAAKREGITPEELNLDIYVRLYVRIYSLYHEKGIEDGIYFDTVRREVMTMTGLCMKEKGICGILQTKYRAWMRYSLDGRLFALGALNFELRFDSEFTGEVDGVKLSLGDTHISVHIPRDEKLSEDACEAAYECAREFFRRHFGLEKIIFLCHSWMLHPWLEEVLPETSGILKFSRKYKKIEVIENLVEVKFWLYPDDEETPIENLPQKTSLHRAFIERVSRGESVGVACGIRI